MKGEFPGAVRALGAARSQYLGALALSLIACAVLLWTHKWISDDGYI